MKHLIKAQVREEYTTCVRNQRHDGTYFIAMAQGELAIFLMQQGQDLQLSEEGGLTPDADMEYYAMVTTPELATYIKTRFG